MIPPLQTVPPVVALIGSALVSSAIASVLYWAAKQRGRDDPDVQYDPARTAATLAVGFVLALGLALAPDEVLSQTTLAERMILFGPFVVYVEKWIRELGDARSSSSSPSPRL